MNGARDFVFVDTNVLLYEVDGADPAKQLTCRRWLEALWQAGSARVSWQVLNEFYVNATRKAGAPAATCRRLVETYVQWKPVEFSLPLLQRAWHWVDGAGITFWDALILAAAERSGCRWLLSEDFSHGRKYGSVQVVNPFDADPNEILGG
jgi:predicted nucleic acid-binding protein